MQRWVALIKKSESDLVRYFTAFSKGLCKTLRLGLGLGGEGTRVRVRVRVRSLGFALGLGSV